MVPPNPTPTLSKWLLISIKTFWFYSIKTLLVIDLSLSVSFTRYIIRKSMSYINVLLKRFVWFCIQILSVTSSRYCPKILSRRRIGGTFSNKSIFLFSLLDSFYPRKFALCSTCILSKEWITVLRHITFYYSGFLWCPKVIE